MWNNVAEAHIKIKVTVKDRQLVYALLIGGSLCIFLLMSYITNGAIVMTILFPNINDNYMDFFNSLIDAACINPYTERNVIYPPLCYVIYNFFGHLIPPDYYTSGSVYIRTTIEGMLSFGYYMLISVLALCFFSIKYMEKKQVKNTWFVVAQMLSAPVLFSIQRGNFIIFSVACLLAFLCYKDSSSCIKRHFGLFMLAVAANIKIYPALFGLLLVSERKWRDCISCIAYGIILFCVPMLRFGGFSNIPVLIHNIMSTTSGFASRLGTRADLGCLLSFLSAKGVMSGTLSFLSENVLIWGTALLFICYSCFEEEWKQIMCLTLICTFIPGFSYMYNLLYLLPLMIVLSDQAPKWIFFLAAVPFVYYPFDISSISWLHVEGAEILPRCWDIVSSLSGLALIGVTMLEATKVLIIRRFNRVRIRFNAVMEEQIALNSRVNK